ncbi:hypothetical protein DRN52_07830 [Thermococci archaeon]|nr:MAG: hypothetical protein DRN52_07830 [Thermococci archaeon]
MTLLLNNSLTYSSRRPGFEPGITGSGGHSGTESSDERIENMENMRILEDFRDYLTVERRLGKRTVERYMLEIRKLFRKARFDPLRAKRLEIRDYLRNFIDKPANSYANVLKALRIFYRDYLGRGEVIEGFRFPSRPFKVVVIPSKRSFKNFIDG